MSSLQWGHSDDGVEDSASAASGRSDFKLQWGHSDDGVEDIYLNWVSNGTPVLQWGHSDDGVEDDRHQAAKEKTAAASMGPLR